MLTFSQFADAVAFAQDGATLPESTLHGDRHWRAVAMQGLTLATVCKLPQQAHHVAALFGLFHDCRRVNDDYDPEHGARGGRALLASPVSKYLPVSIAETLATSCQMHDGGQTTDDKLLGLGWDADRSVLTRVGVQPDISYFSVVREPDFVDFIASGIDKTRNPPTWSQIWEMAFAG